MNRANLGLALVALLGFSACGSGARRHFFVERDGAQLKVALDGNVDSDVILLLLHGGPNGSSHVYNSGQAMVDIEDKYGVAYLDQRGQGASQGRYDSSEYGVFDAAEDVDAVLDMLRHRFGDEVDLYLLGHSWGGMLGTVTLLETDASDELSGWIETAGCHDALLEPRYVEARLRDVGDSEVEAGNSTADWGQILSFLDVFDAEAESFDNSDLVQLNQYGYRAESLIEEITFEDPIPEDRWSGIRDAQRDTMSWATSFPTIRTLYDESTSMAYTSRLGEISVPGHYMYAKYDFVCPVQLGVDAADANASGIAEVVIFEASGHSLMSNEPDLFASEIIEFVEATRQR